MSHAPRHSNSRISVSAQVGAGLGDRVVHALGLGHHARDARAHVDRVAGRRARLVEHVVERHDRRQVGGRHLHHRGHLAQRGRRAPAVHLLRGVQRRDRRRAAVRVARHVALDRAAQRRRGTSTSAGSGMTAGSLLRSAACPSRSARPDRPSARCCRSGRARSAVADGGRRGGRWSRCAAPVDPMSPLGLDAEAVGLQRPSPPPSDRRRLMPVELHHRSTPPRIGSSIATDAIMSATSAALAHRGQRLQVVEARVAHVHARGLGRTVGEDETAQLAARRLDRRVDLARRHAEALGHQLEVVDQRLHRRRQLVPRRQRDLAVVGDVGPVRQVVERLLDDPAPTRASRPCGPCSGRSCRPRCRSGP